MRKFILVFILFNMLCSLSADTYKVSISSKSRKTIQEISVFDIISTSKKDSEIVYLLNLTPEEALQLKLLMNLEPVETKLLENKENYSDLEQINERIDNFVKNHSNIAKVFTIGRSVEDRDIKAIRLSLSTSEAAPEILFVGLHHAREWISSEVPLAIAEFAVNNQESNPFVRNILENSVLWFVPMLNPDGYVYSWEVDRMWRYNRKIHPDSTVGVDLNRNYSTSWKEMEYIHGTEPFSEPETQAIKDLIENTVSPPVEFGIKSLDGLISYHSYGQMILYPTGSSSDPPEEVELYGELSSKMSSYIFSQCGSNYLPMQIFTLCVTFGEMTEWFMVNNENKPSFTFELRPHQGDSSGFILSPEQISDTIKENIPAAFYFVRTIIDAGTQVEMDADDNGNLDVIQNTRYDYECSRDDVIDKDQSNDADNLSSDLEDEVTDSDLIDNETETPDPDQFRESSGCSLTKLL